MNARRCEIWVEGIMKSSMEKKEEDREWSIYGEDEQTKRGGDVIFDHVISSLSI